MPDVTRIPVSGDSPYEVIVGHGVLDDVATLVGDAARVAVVHSSARHDDAVRVIDALGRSGPAVLSLPVPDGEAAKTAEVAAHCWAELGRAGFTRSDVVVGVGGGATTDLAGFVAATWLRGVRLVTVPTSLLGMVDAAVGGKTGINTGEGKNLVGSFHEPAGVVCDLDVLRTLPHDDLVSGLAEVVKVGFTSDPAILELVRSDLEGATDPSSNTLRELVERAIRVKAQVVSADLRESRPGGLGREVLNYGHTFAHAIEQVERYTWKHGHAVSVGLVYVAALARLAGRLDASTADDHGRILRDLGLPTAYAANRFDVLLDAMRVDKKSRGDQLRFVVLDAIGSPGLLEGPSTELLAEAYAEVSKEDA